MPSQDRLALLRLEVMAAEYKERVGSRIREAREARKWSQNELARNLPGTVGGDQVGRWERGEVMPRPATLEAIADALLVDVSYFLVAEPDEGTADLMGSLSDRNGHLQLDRIEAKLDVVLTILRQLVPDDETTAELLADLEGPGQDQARRRPLPGRAA